MTKKILPLYPECISELSHFLIKGFNEPDDAAFATPECLLWKYFDPDGSNNITRSLIAFEDGQIIGHVGICPSIFYDAASEKSFPSMHMMDWIGLASHAPIGAILMLKARNQISSQFCIGGTEEGRNVTKRIGYKIRAKVPVYTKILNLDYFLKISGHCPAWKKLLKLGRNYLRILVHRTEHPKVSLALKKVDSFGEEVSQISNICKMKEIYTIRTSERLNHYLRHPQQEFSGWRILQADRVCGFALLNVVHKDGVRNGKIVDLFLDCVDENIWQSALYLLIIELQKQKADFVECYGTTQWMKKALQRNGFFSTNYIDFTLRDPDQVIPSDSLFYLTFLEADLSYL